MFVSFSFLLEEAMAVKKYLKKLKKTGYPEIDGMDALESSFLRDVVCVVLNLLKCI